MDTAYSSRHYPLTILVSSADSINLAIFIFLLVTSCSKPVSYIQMMTAYYPVYLFMFFFYFFTLLCCINITNTYLISWYQYIIIRIHPVTNNDMNLIYLLHIQVLNIVNLTHKEITKYLKLTKVELIPHGGFYLFLNKTTKIINLKTWVSQ